MVKKEEEEISGGGGADVGGPPPRSRLDSFAFSQQSALKTHSHTVRRVRVETKPAAPPLRAQCAMPFVLWVGPNRLVTAVAVASLLHGPRPAPERSSPETAP